MVLFSSIRRHKYSELLEQMSLLRSRLDISFFKSHSTRQICRQCCNKCQDSRHPPFFSAAGGLAGKAFHKFQHTPVKWQVWSSAIAEEPGLRFPDGQHGAGAVCRAILCFPRFVTRESSVITLGLCASWQVCQRYSAHRGDFRLPAMRCYVPFASTMRFQDHDNWNTIICIRDICLLWIQKAGPSSLGPVTSIFQLEERQC